MIQATLNTFYRYRFLLQNLITRDLKVKYRRSVLGIMWSLLNPLLIMLVLNAVFSRVLRIEVEYFPLYLISGQMLFTFFTEATSGALSSIVDASSLIKKVYVPKYIFPLEKMLYAFVNFMFSQIAVIVMLFMFRIKASWTMLLFPIPLLTMLGFIIGFGWILSSLCVYFRDIKHLYQVLTTAWLYMTPIFYKEDMLGEGLLHTIVMINPLTHYVRFFRDVVIYGVVSSTLTIVLCFGYAILFLIIGFIVFIKTQDNFILHI